MTNTTNYQAKASQRYHPECGRIGADVDLGTAILIAETEAGQYEIISPVAAIDETREVAAWTWRTEHLLMTSSIAKGMVTQWK
jgi:hypothetical protein